MLFKELERCIPSQAYEKALEADKAAWQDSVRRRVEGRARLKKDVPDS